MIEINSEKCVRCGSCIDDCVVKVLERTAEGTPAPIPQWEQYCINCQHCLTICPAEAIVLNGKSAFDCSFPGSPSRPGAMFDLIRQRCSVRQWSDKPVSDISLRLMKRSLDWTPTGCNAHSLRFTFVLGQDEMDKFRKLVYAWLRRPVVNGLLRFFYPKFCRYLDEIRDGQDVVFRDAPNMVLASVPRRAPCAAFDPVIALTQFDLMAQSLGVGTCWCGFGLGLTKLLPGMRRLFQIEKGYVPGALMLFGMPNVKYKHLTNPEPYVKIDIKSAESEKSER